MVKTRLNSQFLICKTYTRNADVIFVPDMHVLDGHLDVVEEFCEERCDEALVSCAVFCTFNGSRSIQSYTVQSYTFDSSCLHLERLGILKAFKFCALHAALEFMWIFAILLAWDDKKIDVFDENFDGLVP